MVQPGVQTKRTVLNVFGASGKAERYILDSLKVTLTLHMNDWLATNGVFLVTITSSNSKESGSRELKSYSRS